MKTIDLRDEVSRAVGQEWAAFERDHPRLAAVLDRELVIDDALASLADDAEYRRVLAEATATGIAAEAVTTLVTRYVREWLGKLLG